jgi:hypothetical protein
MSTAQTNEESDYGEEDEEGEEEGGYSKSATYKSSKWKPLPNPVEI